MAFLILNTGKGLTLPYDKAVKLKAVMDGKEQGTDKQQAFAARVKHIYLGKQHEPALPKAYEPVDAPLPYWHR